MCNEIPKKTVLFIVCILLILFIVFFSFKIFNQISSNVVLQTSNNTQVSNISMNEQNISFEELNNISLSLGNYFKYKKYWVSEGEYRFTTINDCVDLINHIGNCGGINPATLGGVFFLPPAPGEFRSPQRENLSSIFRMRSDEAIVVITINPPKSKYFSYIPYLYTRDRTNIGGLADVISTEVYNNVEIPLSELASRYLYYASFGDYPLSFKFINSSNPSNPFNAVSIIILTADKTLDYNLRKALQGILGKYNLSPDIINTIHIPSDVLILGYSNLSDDLQFFSRITYPENATLIENYIKNPPTKILRIVPNASENMNSTKFTFKALPPKNTSIDEHIYQDSLNALIGAVKLSQNSSRILKANFSSILTSWVYLPICLKLGLSCLGDDQSAFYTFFPTPLPIKNNSNEFLMVVGLNHVATKKASTYSSFSIYGSKYNMGIIAINEADFKGNGSIQAYLPYLSKVNSSLQAKKILLNNQDKFFVYKISRDCKNESYCYTLPQNTLFCINQTTGLAYDCYPPEQRKPGVDFNDTISIYERAYVDPFTNIGPDYNQLVQNYYLKYEPSAA